MRIVKKNVGDIDSLFRVITGMFIVFAGLWFSNLWGLFGLILVISGVISFCPFYRLFGIHTCAPNVEREN